MVGLVGYSNGWETVVVLLRNACIHNDDGKGKKKKKKKKKKKGVG